MHHNERRLGIRWCTCIFATVVGINIPYEQIVGECLSILGELGQPRLRVKAENLGEQKSCGQKTISYFRNMQFNLHPLSRSAITLFLKCQLVWLGGSGEYLMIHVRLIVEPCLRR